jgi:hypothetical protein
MTTTTKTEAELAKVTTCMAREAGWDEGCEEWAVTYVADEAGKYTGTYCKHHGECVALFLGAHLHHVAHPAESL